jgi:hypothetical protein
MIHFKKLFYPLIGLILLSSQLAFADATYTYQNPTYIPSAISPLKNYTAPADYVLTAHNLDTVTLQISGTCTSLAATMQGTNQSGITPTPVWTTLNAWPAAGGASVATFGGTGTWRVDVAGLSQARLHITALTASCNVIMSGTSGTMSQLSNINDPCTSEYVVKSSAVLNQATATTAVIVPAVTGKITYVCGFAATAAGTTPTFNFTTGTQASAACDTAAAVTTGLLNPSATIGVVAFPQGATAFTSGAISRQVCMTTAATTSVQGLLTYVQQ